VILHIFFTFVLIVLGLMVAYLDLLTVAALVGTKRPGPAREHRRFAVLIPAHNEELLLPRLLASLRSVDYPPQMYDLHVVADNCGDKTATVAREFQAVVHERRDEDHRGKGYALNWALSRIQGPGSAYDAYVVIDADSVVSKNFLHVLNRHLNRGDRVVQASYLVLNRGRSWVSGLSFIALALFNHLRPRGRDALGLSAGLSGNGMCFASSILDDHRWVAFSLTEDSLFHIQLVRAGIRVRFSPWVTVLAEQPTSLRQARSQSVRWERGRFQLTFAFAPRLLVEGLRRRDLVRLGVVADQMVPQFSILSAGIVACAAAGLLLHMMTVFIVTMVLLAGELVYMLVGLHLVEAKGRDYLALLLSPVYAIWKIWTIAIAALHLQDTSWVRTPRSGEDSPP